MSETPVAATPRDMTAADLDRVVELHKACFPEYFLTGLGDRVVRRFYAEAVADPRSFAAVLEEDESRRLIGLAVGTLDPRFHTRLMRRHLAAFVLGTLRGLLLSAPVRRGLSERLVFIRRLFHAKPDTGLVDAGVPAARGPEARFLDVATHPERRGGRYGEYLVRYFTKRVFQSEAGRLGGSVRPENLASLILYKRLGWNVMKTAPNRVDVWCDRPEVRVP